MSGYTQTVLKDVLLWKGYENETFPNGKCHIVREQTVMSEGDKTVSIYERKLLKGTSNNGVVWHKWKTKNSDHFSVKSGNLEAYRKNGGFLRSATKEFFSFTNIPEVHAALNRLLLKNNMEVIDRFDRSCIFARSYPLFKHMTNYSYRTRGIPHMHAKDMQEFTRKLFGKTRYRKDLVRTVASVENPNVIKNGHDLRGLVPIDWIIKYMEKNKKTDAYMIHRIYGIRGAFKKLTMNQRKAIVTALTHRVGDEYYISDLIDFIHYLPEEVVQAVKMKPSTLYDAHNALSVERTKQMTQDRTIEPSKLAKRISGIDLKDFTEKELSIVPATSTHQVLEWGQKMNHCIGSYAQQAANGSCTLTAIYEDGKLIGNAMFDFSRASGDRRDRCVQIFGKNNQQLPEYVLKPIIEALKPVSFKSTYGVPYLLQNPDVAELTAQGMLPNAHLDPVPF